MTEAAPPGSATDRRSRRRRFSPVGFVLLPVVLGLWQLAAVTDLASDRTLPTPVEVADALVQLLQRGYFYDNLWVTLRVIGIGMAGSLVLGIGVATAIGTVPVLRAGVYPYIVALNIVPKVALVPLLTIVIGYNSTSRIVIVIMAATFPVFLNTLTAIREARDDRDRLMRSLGASRWQRLRMHTMPEGAPTIFAGVKLSLTIAFIATILAEFLIARDGLAYLIISFRISLNAPMMYAVTVAVAALGLLFYVGLDRIERRIVFWDRDDREGTDR